MRRFPWLELLFDALFLGGGGADVLGPDVSNPEFFKQVNGVIESESLDALKAYVGWHLLDSAAPWLSKPYVDANFKMQQQLTGSRRSRRVGSAA